MMKRTTKGIDVKNENLIKIEAKRLLESTRIFFADEKTVADFNRDSVGVLYRQGWYYCINDVPVGDFKTSNQAVKDLFREQFLWWF